jgi:hypothetical protein
MRKHVPLLLVLVALGFLVAGPGFAQDASIGLSKRLTCYVFYTLAESTVGLLIGFVIALFGLWTIIKGNTMAGIFTILAGAAVTALPYLVVSFFEGSQTVLRESDISTGGVHIGAVVDDIHSESGGFKDCESIAVNMSAYAFNPVGATPGTFGSSGGVSPLPGFGDAYTQPASAACQSAVAGRETIGGPVAGGGRLSSCFGARDRPCPTCSQYHKGIDIAAPLGTDVTAWGEGRVVAAGCNGNCNGTARQGLGYFVQVDYGNGRIDTYSHLQGDPTSLLGSNVTRGTRLGGVGNTGASTGPHLDYRVQINGAFVDPLNHMQ